MRSLPLPLCLLCFASPGLGQAFVDVAGPAGVETVLENSAHASWGDFDCDGDPDLFLGINGGSFDPNDILYRSSNGSFADVAAQAGVQGHQDLAFQHASAWGDYDKDGRLDLFVVSSHALELFHNDGDGTFTEVAAAAGVDQPSDAARGVAWGDLDGDGWIDLFLTYWNEPERLLRNAGDGTFSEVPGAGGCAGGNLASPSVSLADYDGDGLLDVYVARFSVPNALYKNNGGMSFADVTAAVGLKADDSWAAGAFGDHDGDGDLDLFVSDMSGGSSISGRHYVNQGNGSFVDMGTSTGLRFTHTPGLNPRGAGWGDYDADGDLDLYLVFNRTSAGALPNPNRLLRNEGNGTFLNVAPTEGVDDGSQGNGFAWADYDGDGFLDLFVVNEYGFPCNLYRSQGNANHWAKIRLAGTASGTSGIGARVRLRAGGTWQLREVSGAGTGFGCQDDLPVEFGVGAEMLIEEVEVRWPTGAVDQWFNLPADAELVLVQGASIGTTYCAPAVPNSTGVAAQILAFGSALVADQNLLLQATRLPVGQFGYFLVGSDPGFVANPGGSQGNLCLANTIGRFVKQVKAAGPAGEFHVTVDLLDLPLFGAVVPGDTWRFTAWYRDQNPVSTSNFTDAVTVTFL